ncbi:UNVERIFIED_CONTAM: hypothetical protein FKN15_042866 [Acipenser sinensis]
MSTVLGICDVGEDDEEDFFQPIWKAQQDDEDNKLIFDKLMAEEGMDVPEDAKYCMCDIAKSANSTSLRTDVPLDFCNQEM